MSGEQLFFVVTKIQVSLAQGEPPREEDVLSLLALENIGVDVSNSVATLGQDFSSLLDTYRGKGKDISIEMKLKVARASLLCASVQLRLDATMYSNDEEMMSAVRESYVEAFQEWRRVSHSDDGKEFLLRNSNFLTHHDRVMAKVFLEQCKTVTGFVGVGSNPWREVNSTIGRFFSDLNRGLVAST